MIIPLGAEGLRRRLPAATLALLAANTLAFMISYPLELARRDRSIGALTTLVSQEAELEARFVGGHAAAETWMPSRLREPTAVEREFWEDFAAGSVLPKDDPAWLAWRKANDDWQAADQRRVFQRWGYRPDRPSAVTVLSCLFLHDGALHLVFNMLFLWAVGANTEDSWGRRMFLLLYLLGGVAATLAHGAATPDTETGVPLVGASGAVAAVMGAFMIRHFRMRIRILSLVPIGTFAVPAGVLLPAWFALQVWGALADDGGGGVAFMAHVGGFVFGAVLAVALRLGDVERTILAPQLEREDRARAKAQALERAELARQRGRARELVAELTAALDADPDDVEIRREKLELHWSVGQYEDGLAEAEELLRRLWRQSERAAFVELYRSMEARAPDRMPAAMTYRAGLALEEVEPYQAAALLRRAAQAHGDPISERALSRYAALLDRLGAATEAERVREIMAGSMAGSVRDP